MTFRPLLAAALAAVVLQPVTSAVAAGDAAAVCHSIRCLSVHVPPCAFHPICDELPSVIELPPASRSHTLCHRVEERAPWLIVCHD